ncbi:hypothetical protein ACB098_01G249500 [Castanea mollissima]|uniref:Uncharacterized protein n=1 Tax=Castanea mollissima TaxID=60419 RepID=A0A8J4RJR9_9ROSI|nr:hypothetical protein CMV_011904 [Castanea mollissima]
MGSCVSIYRNSSSAMKLSLGSKDDKLVIPPSPIKENPINGDRPIILNNVVSVKSQWSPSLSTPRVYGSKEETFFDSQPWLESDCEDDFYSVNGDFTPSRGNTPVHHNLSIGTPRINIASFEDRMPGSLPEPSPTDKIKKLARFEDRMPGSLPEPSPTDKKKKLAELFRENSRHENEDVDNLNTSSNQNMANGNMEVKPIVLDLTPKSAHGTPYGTNSVCSSEKTPNGDIFTDKEKPMRSVQCCLPSLISSRSFSDRKKKRSPAIAVHDEH